MTKLFSRATVSGSSLSGANLKAALTALWDALSSVGITDASRTTVTASATLTVTQCGLLLVDCSSGSVTLTLPTSGTSTDEAEYRIRRIDSTYANTLTVQAGGSDTVESASTAIVIGAGGQVDVKLAGGSSDWKVVGRGGGTSLAAREALGVPMVNDLDNPDGAIYQRAIAATSDDNYAEDRWYVLTQTGSVTPSQGTSPENGYATYSRLTQSQASAQRFGYAQIVPAHATRELRGKTVTFGGRFQLSTSANLRFAILAWTGTADTVTSDVVADWTNGSFATGAFFNSTTLSLVATASKAMTAGTAASASVSGVIPSGATNIIVLYWTEATAAQNVTLDGWGRRLVEGVTLGNYIRRSLDEELRRCQRWAEKYSGPQVYLTKLRELDRERSVGIQFRVTKASVPGVTLLTSNADGAGAITAAGIGVDGVRFASTASADSQQPSVTSFIATCDL